MTASVITSMVIKLTAVVMLAWRQKLQSENYTLSYMKQDEGGFSHVVADYYQTRKSKSARRVRAV